MKTFSYCLALAVLLADRTLVAQSINTSCFATPEEAAQQLPVSVASYSGYRLQSRRWDPILNRGWANVASCDHPERPEVVVALTQPAPNPQSAKSAATLQAIPTVRVGDTVRVQYYEQLFHIEMVAVAQANGNAGDKIRVRINHGVLDAGVPEQYVTAVVLGPHRLEMQR